MCKKTANVESTNIQTKNNKFSTFCKISSSEQCLVLGNTNSSPCRKIFKEIWKSVRTRIAQPIQGVKISVKINVFFL